VDDFSTDGTREFLEKQKGITLIKLKKNSGPSVAVNTGLSKARTEYVVCVDSDSYPQKDVLFKLMGYFEEKDVAAVTCLVLPDKKDTIIQKLQYLEYLVSFGLNNALLSSISSSYVVPGPFTVFQRKIFEKVGFFEQGNLAQDMEFGLRLKSFGLKIMSCYEAVVLTDVPSNWRGLFKQRDRWYRGGTFNFVKYKQLMFNKKNPDFGFFIMPFVFFTQILTVAVLLRVLVFFLNDLHGFLLLVFKYVFLGGTLFINPAGIIIPLSFLFFLAAYFFVTIYFLLGFWVTKKMPSLSDLPILLMLIFIYPYFLTFTYSQAYLKELIGVRAKWQRVST
jgi:cellulose synthase/poly-beta-1,6-N-acetylglucosamine synthase-like glycosyltransferase